MVTISETLEMSRFPCAPDAILQGVHAVVDVGAVVHGARRAVWRWLGCVRHHQDLQDRTRSCAFLNPVASSLADALLAGGSE